MKSTMLSAAVAAAVLFGINGCDHGKTTKDNTQKALQQISKVSLQTRKKALDENLKSFLSYGFDVNQTAPDSYILSVTNEEVCLTSLLNLFNTNTLTLDPNDKAAIETLLKNAKIGVKIDWDKYVSNQENSVFLYYLGNGMEAPYLKKLFNEKKIGIFLGYDSKDRLKTVKIKDIDEVLNNKHIKIQVALKGMHARVNKAPDKTSYATAYDLFGGTFNYTVSDTETNQTVVFGFKDPVCNIDKSNAYLGRQQCRFPLINIEFQSIIGKQHKGVLHFVLKNTSFNYKTTAHNKKIKADLSSKIDTVDIEAKEIPQNSTLTIKNIKLSGNTDNLDETLFKSYIALLKHPSQDQNKTIKEMMSFVGKLYSSGMTYDYTFSVDRAEGGSDKGTFLLEGYAGHGKGSFSKTIEYTENDTVKLLRIHDTNGTQPMFELNNFTLGYSIGNLYNFIPAFFDFSAAVAMQQSATQNPQLPSDIEKKLADMGSTLVHHGFDLTLGPIGWERFNAHIKGRRASLGKSILNIKAALKRNNISLNPDNPISALMLLPYLQADGKLVLPKKDLEELAKSVPPQMIGMLMMLAKYDGDNAVFILKFENGHLLINGQPLI